MKKTIIAFVFLFLCVSCSNENTGDRGLKSISGDGFSLEGPANWEELSQAELPLPKSGDLVLALASPEEKQGYVNNLIILRGEEASSQSSDALVKSNMSFLQQNMLSFALKSEKSITFSDESQGTLILFSGRYNTQTPSVNYLQTARNCGGTNYFITLSLAEDLESYSPYEYILQSLSCE